MTVPMPLLSYWLDFLMSIHLYFPSWQGRLIRGSFSFQMSSWTISFLNLAVAEILQAKAICSWPCPLESCALLSGSSQCSFLPLLVLRELLALLWMFRFLIYFWSVALSPSPPIPKVARIASLRLLMTVHFFLISPYLSQHEFTDGSTSQMGNLSSNSFTLLPV